MATSYNPYYSGGWQSGEEGGTPITPDSLNHMDDGIAGAYDYTQQSTADKAISLHINGSTWSDLWTALSTIPTAKTGVAYILGTAVSLITGGQFSSACDGIIARYTAGTGFNFLLVQQSTGKLINTVVTFDSAHTSATVGNVKVFE